jgi:hypothetical protein
VSGALVIPCPLLVAWAWARGDVGDFDLMQSPRVSEAVYWSMLPNRAVFARAVRQTLSLWQAGASCLVLRTDSPEVIRHVEKWGAFRTVQDPSGRWRFYAGPEVCNRYFGRMAQNSLAESGVTNSR